MAVHAQASNPSFLNTPPCTLIVPRARGPGRRSTREQVAWGESILTRVRAFAFAYWNLAVNAGAA